MSARLATAARRLRSDQSGFTLVELLVVCLVSIIVVIALFTFQEVVLRGSNRVFAKVDATQRARTTLEQIESRLRSACLSENITPIQAGSTNTKLSFLSRYGSAASLTPEKHEIALNTSTGVLTDTTYAVTGGTAPNWTFSSTGTSRRLLDHVTQVPGVPLFRYYAYGIARDSSSQPYLDAAGNTYLTLLDGTSTLPTGTTTSAGGNVSANTIPANSPSPLPAPETAAGMPADSAKLAAEVVITMRVGASGQLGDNVNLATTNPVTVQNSVVLRLTPVPSEGNLPTVSPCE